MLAAIRNSQEQSASIPTIRRRDGPPPVGSFNLARNGVPPILG